MGISGILVNIVCLAIMEVLSSILLPAGKMKNFAMKIIGLFLFYSLAVPIIEFLNLNIL